MSSKPYILSVDDEQLNQEIIVELLEEYFDLKVLSDGQQCLDSVAEKMPELILLDVNMPVLDGLKTCEKLKSDDRYQDIPIIFVSALATPKERLAGYQVGGDDYLTKPFDENELVSKINLLLKNKTKQATQVEEKQYAINTAMTAMNSASEAGVVLHFMTDLLKIEDQQQLEKRVFSALQSYGLDGCLMFAHRQPAVYLFSDNIARPIEKDIIDETFNNGRIIEFSGRAIFNSKHAAILIRRMPEDEERKGRYKDHLALLIDALDAKLVQFIEMDKKLTHYQELQQTIKIITKNLGDVNQSYQQQRSLNTEILGQLAQQVEASFLSLGLDETQEDTMLGLITDAEKKTDMVFEKGKQSEQTLNAIVNKLATLLLSFRS